MNAKRRQRLITGVLLAGAALAILFLAASEVWAAVCLLLVTVTTAEFVHLVKPLAPSAGFKSLLIAVPVASAGLWWAALTATNAPAVPGLIVGGALVTLYATLSTLGGGTSGRDAAVAMGIKAFAVIYFAVPTICLTWLQRTDPWLVTLLLAIVALGDTAAYFIGSAIGRHKLAPTVSPKKTWEGAIAHLLAGVTATVAWSFWRRGVVELDLLGLAALTSLFAQMGDLTESAIKRGVGAKDSSQLLPGHGGLFDRLDALLLAAPVFFSGLWLLGYRLAL